MFGAVLFFALTYSTAQDGISGPRNTFEIVTDAKENAMTVKRKINPKNFCWVQKSISSKTLSQNPGEIFAFSSGEDDSLVSKQRSTKAIKLPLKPTARDSNDITKRTVTDTLTSFFPCIPHTRYILPRSDLLRRQRRIRLDYPQLQPALHILTIGSTTCLTIWLKSLKIKRFEQKPLAETTSVKLANILPLQFNFSSGSLSLIGDLQSFKLNFCHKQI